MVTKKKPLSTNNSEGVRKTLYIGTTEAVAKIAPVKGVEPPSVLSDVYPAYFAFWASTSDEQRWGIIEVDIENLMPDSFAPFHGYIEKLGRRNNKKYTSQEVLDRREQHLAKAFEQKGQWQESLENCGVILYAMKIPSHAVTKVTIYSPFEKGGNAFITEGSIRHDPWEISPPKHKAAYAFNLALTQWLACESVTASQFEGNGHKLTEVEDHLQNRLGLDLYYRRTEKDLHHWWKI